MTTDEVLKRLKGVRASGKDHLSLCPAHDDDTPSLSIKTGDDGRTLLHCHAGCETRDVLKEIGLSERDLFAEWAEAKSRARIVAEYPYCDERGELLYQAVRLEPKSFRQRIPNGLGGWTWRINGVRRVLYRLPELLAADPAETVYIVEGEKDVDRLRSLGLVATTNAGGAGKWRSEYSECLRGRRVVVIPDNDDPGRHHADQVAQSLAGIVGRVAILVLPGLPPKGDVSNWLDSGGTIEQLRALVAAAPEWAQVERAAQSNGPPRIVIGTDEARVNDEVIAALAADESIYQRGGQLVHVIEEPTKPDGIARLGRMPTIAPLPKSTLRERMAASARWVHIKGTTEGDEEKVAHPPSWSVSAVHSRGRWGEIRPLEAVVHYPVLRRDGTILATSGYDSRTGLLLAADVKITVPDAPTPDDIRAAVDLLMDLLVDFPFAKPAHRATWLAFLLTSLARFAFVGPAPLFLVDANVRGSGKSLLCDLVSIILTGRDMPRMSNPRDKDEARKRIMALAIAGELLVLIDNIDSVLGCAELDAALTGTVWHDRILGHSEMLEMPLNATWAGTGNNVAIASDTSRRVAWIRLESPMERPEEREGFRHADIRQWARDNRGRLLSAGLTILRGYYVAGRPTQRLTPWGSFEGWTDVVRSAVVWAGLDDPGSTRRELADRADTEAAAHRAILSGIQALDPEGHGLTVREILDRIEGPDRQTEAAVMLTEAFTQICNSSGRLPSPKSIGRRLRHLRGRIVGGKALESTTQHKMSVWYVRSIEGGLGGLGGFVSPAQSTTQHNGSAVGEESPFPPQAPRPSPGSDGPTAKPSN